MARYTADVRLEVTVEFDDDGESSIPAAARNTHIAGRVHR